MWWSVVSQLESLLSDIASTEMRLAASVVIILFALGLGWLLIPRIVTTTQRLVGTWSERLLRGRAEKSRDKLAVSVPISALLRLFIGLLQLLLFVLTIVAILILWGQLDVVLFLLPLAEDVFSIGTRIVITVGLLGGAYIGSDLLDELITEFSQDTDQITAHQQQLLTRLVQVSLLVLAAITALGVWGIDLSGFLVGAGFLGIVLGMAARQTLGSLIAGFVLMFSRPFEIGDWVQIGEEEGFITEITIMNTHMRNFDGEYVVIPNDNVTDDAITNRTREGKIRLHMDVGIDYESDPTHACEIAQSVLDDIDSIANNPQPHVIPAEFGDSAIILDMRFWIDPPMPQLRWRSKAAIVTRIQKEFAAEGISIPFPQRVVSDRSPGQTVPGTGDPFEKPVSPKHDQK